MTIGRGYDLGNRTKAAVKLDMTKAGISEETAKAIAEGAGLKGSKAKDFVKNKKSTIGKITHEQQVKLFDNIYPDYEVRAKTNYKKWTDSEKDRVVWNKLHQAIRDVLVDFVYQGFTRGAKPMKAGMSNDFDELIKYINGSSIMKRYEAGRSRVSYLTNRKPAK